MHSDPNSRQATPLSRCRSSARRGFTLVEVMIAAALTLMMMAVVVQLFARVGGVAADTRAVTQLNDRLRAARIILQSDLANVTAEMRPPLRSNMGLGYFEYVEGPDGPVFKGTQAAYNINETDASGNLLPDTTVGDPDDILMFTARAADGGFFSGRARYLATLVTPNGPVQTPMDGMTKSSTAEICYFVRGDTLYRRVLLIAPTIGNNGVVDPILYLRSSYNPPVSTGNPPYAYDINFYDKFDVSVRQEGGIYDLTTTNQRPMVVANTLNDLTLRQNRYGHQPWVYPHDVRFWDARLWNNPATNVPGAFLGLPTLRECTFYTNTQQQNSGIARWPFPLFDSQNDPTLPYGGQEVQNLWGLAMPSGSPFLPYSALPYIYPYPNTNAAAYQPVTTVPGSPTGRMVLTATKGAPYDIWENPYPLDQQDPLTGSIYAFSSAYQPPNWVNVDFSTRYSDDILLQHVLSFDVKAWDPTAPTLITTTVIGGVPPGMYQPGDLGFTQIIANWASNGTLATNLDPTTSAFVAAQGNYVDLNYLGSLIATYSNSGNTAMVNTLSAVSVFSGPGVAQNASGLGMLYDTGSFSYENDGIDQNGDGIVDNYTNGIDDNGIGGVDDLTEIEGPVPYPVPLKGIQIKIRMFDPDSREIREVTVTEDF